MEQTPIPSWSPSMGLISNSFSYWENPNLTKYSRCKCQSNGSSHWPSSAGCFLANTTQYAAGCLHLMGTLLTNVVCCLPTPNSDFLHSCFVSRQIPTANRVVPFQMQNMAFAFVELSKIHDSPFLQAISLSTHRPILQWYNLQTC